ncbi:MAG TPA: hypothetical protein VFP15_10170, partial [Gemmatimonadaceae bacterium]|nr:hypothetical protein [Gemmatimonadaceae bacterium]
MAPAAAAAALMMMSGWLVDQSVGYVIGATLATVLALVSGLRWNSAGARAPLYITVASLVVATFSAGRAELRLGQFERAPAAVSADEAAAQE